ncbi:MAG: DUF348 domain-containing protein [Anaerolineales bacterium]|nr:DUF348 domain-containing protein [Anaerolineales bacterium]
MAVVLLVAVALLMGYRATRLPITLVLNGQQTVVYTHQDTVSTLLLDRNVPIEPNDRVVPSLDTPLRRGMTVIVQRPHPVYVTADGQTLLLHTHQTAAEMILQEARVSLGPYDELRVEGNLVATGHARVAINLSSRPLHLTVVRAIPFTLDEEGRISAIHTTAPTVGEALHRAGLVLYQADRVEPALGERIRRDMSVRVDRSMPVTVQVDGRLLRTRTHRDHVDTVLADLGIVLTGQDYTTPTLDTPLQQDMTIRVVRVTERFLIEQEPIPFESVWQGDPNLELDTQALLQEGAPGTLQRRVRVFYEDGEEVRRWVESEYVTVPPTTKIMGYGTNVIVRTLDTPSGPVEYWRVIRMLATSYSAGTSGTSPSSSWYGRTSTGMQMGFGIVAVDPRVINLRSRVYVPGYGVGVAGDTGGSIKGRRIDMGFDDSNLQLWYRWVDVYLLTPVPANIDYTLGLQQ